MAILNKILRLGRQLLPTGRAFRMPFGGTFDALMTGLAQSEQRAYDDAMSIFNAVLPDNAAFTAEDATAWERRLGLITNSSITLADRKSAIIRKMNHPGTIKPRQHYLYQQAQLRAVGFDVYVHENLLRINPGTLSGFDFQHGDGQHGDEQHGAGPMDRVANKVDSEGDADFNAGTTYANVYFIGGQTFGTIADVDASRETEFRELILRLKPTNQIAYLLINYV